MPSRLRNRSRIGACLWVLGVSISIGHAAPVASPSRGYEPRLIALVDVETTGLDPSFHEMVDLGVTYIRSDGEVVGRFFTRIYPGHPERLDPSSAAVNGFSLARWQTLGALSESEAVQRWQRIHRELSDGSPVTFAAFNAWFDQAFTDALLRRHGSSWRALFHYQILDLPSMAWAQGARDLANAALAERYGIAPETRDPLRHTGESGADFNLALYRAIVKVGENSDRERM